MRIDRTGRNRFVLLTRRYALKFPSLRCWRDFLFGLLNNMNERAWHADQPGHCPVLFALPLGFLVVMPRLRILTDAEFAAIAEDDLPPARAERKASSWGWLAGRPIAVDYGW